jgi:hypothetical protein
MVDLIEDFRRRLAPVALRLWPGLGNPAWGSAGAARLFGDRLRLVVDPQRIGRKLTGDAAAVLRRRFLVRGFDALPTMPVAALYTYRDMEDIARHGADWRSTRLGQWLLASIAAGRPPLVRGRLITDEAAIEAYCRGYWTMFESMRATGYRYEGDDHMCFGIDAAGNFVLVRRGTHRLAAAHILGLKQVAGQVTHLDRRFAEAAVRQSPGVPVPDAIVRGIGRAAA